MSSLLVAFVVFLAMAGASLGTLLLYPKLPDRHRSDETNAVIRLVANVFVVMTSLVFGLLINSARTTFESVDANIHAYGTSLIVLDRTLRAYGADGDDARAALRVYLAAAITHFERGEDVLQGRKGKVEDELNSVAARLDALIPHDPYQQALLVDVRQQYRTVLAQRWKIVEQSEGTIPSPVIFMLGAWLTLIFASFGYRAPCNRVVILVFVGAALLIATSLYLVLDMNLPFQGPVQVSDAPLLRAAAEIAL